MGGAVEAGKLCHLVDFSAGSRSGTPSPVSNPGVVDVTAARKSPGFFGTGGRDKTY